MVRVQSTLPGGARRRELPGREGVAPLSAGGTLYSDEREILDAERDYWQPRVAVHFGAKLLKWATLDFGQGIPRVLVVLNPTARKQTLRAIDMRATVDREQRDRKCLSFQGLSMLYATATLSSPPYQGGALS